MSYSGRRGMVLNTLERILSSDMNRLQSFAAFGQAEMWRALINSSAGSDDVDAGGLFTEYSSTDNPMRAEIFGGLLVQPIAGSMTCSVTDGVMMCLDPDAVPDPDDSPYKMIRDPGVLATAPLVITGNVSGSIRIDVIECARVAAPGYTVVETSSRDIYNPVTGLFTATSVPKVTEGRLQYRVRAGTPGAGFPGTSSGWTPLAVVSVPSGAGSVDAMTFWDVRPLLNDRSFGLPNLGSDVPTHLDMSIGTASGASGQTDITVQGIARVHYNGRRLGGKLRRGSPGSDAVAGLIVGSTITDNIAPGTTFSLGGLWYFYLLTPFGLPRWARYTDGPVGRVPRSPRGIPVVSSTAPDAEGRISSAISLPTSTGLGGSTTSGVCVFASIGEGAGKPGLFFGQGRRILPYAGISGITPSVADNNSATFSLVPGSNYPPNARMLKLQASVVPSAIGAAFLYYKNLGTCAPGTSNVVDYQADSLYEGNASFGGAIQKSGWFAVPASYPSATGATFNALWQYIFSGATAGSQSLAVLGFEF